MASLALLACIAQISLCRAEASLGCLLFEGELMLQRPALLPRQLGPLLLRAAMILMLSFVCLVALGWVVALLPLLLMLHAICVEKGKLAHLFQITRRRLWPVRA